jgi:hypothetical protein
MSPNHPIPPCELVFNDHEQCPRDFNVRDPELVRVTQGSLLGAIIRLVGGYNPSTGLWSRTRISCQMNRWLELGWAHLSTVDNVADFLFALATRLPQVAEFAWGEEGRKFAQLSYCTAFVQRFREQKVLPQGLEWFTAGWYQIAVRGDVQRVYLEEWWNHIAQPMTWMQAQGFKSKRLLAAATRARNGSDYPECKKLVDAEGEKLGLERFLTWWEGEGKSDRVAALRSWPEFEGDVEKWPTPDDINWGTALVWPETSGAVSASSGQPSVSGSGGGFSWRNIPTWAKWTGGIVGGLGLLGTAGWFLLGKKKSPRRRRRR